MKYAWSYSSLDQFKQCPHKYYRLRVVKDIVEPESEAMRYGTEVHKAAEDFIKDGTPIPEKFAFMRPILEPVSKIKGSVLCEYRMGLTRDLAPCGFFDKDVWCRGIADLIVLQEDRAWVVDYKTGSNKYPEPKQLKLMALMTFAHFPEVQHVKAGLLFVAHNSFMDEQYSRGDIPKLWSAFQGDLTRLEHSTKANFWPMNPSPLCRWCPVTTCEFHKD